MEDVTVTSNSSAEMAGTIERRRKDLGLTIGDLADAAGLTRQGLDPVRRGELRNYNDRTIMGVARALQWEVDWYERVVAGKKPKPLSQPANGGDDDWNDLKSSLSEQDRQSVRAIIESLKTKNH